MRWWRRKEREQDLERELRSHLELEAEEGTQGGSSDDALYAAQRAFGNTTLVKEEIREMWGWNSLEKLIQDVRYGLRMMRRSPGFTVIAVLSLALGIGANTAIFSLIDTLMLRRLPVRDPERLVELLIRRGTVHFNAFSWQTYTYLSGHNHVFSSLIASPTDRFYTRAEGLEPEKLEGQFVSGNFFAGLGVRPALGRLIGLEDHIGSPAPVAVVSWSYWKSRFNLDPGILGKKITVEEAPLTIVGVTPPEFFGLQIGRSQDISVPLAMEPAIRHPSFTSSAGYKWLRLVGRLRPGTSVAQARAEMNVLFRHTLEKDARELNEPEVLGWKVEVEPAGAGLSRFRDQFSKPLLVLMAIVCLLLLIACANVANMLLARGAARQREMAVRVSLGAGRFRIARQLLTESLLLSLLAAALGALLAYLGSDSLVRIMRTGRLPIELQVQPDGRVLLFTASVALLTGILFGLVPTARVLGATAAPSLRGSGRVGETRLRRVFGKSLVVFQVTLSVVLLAASGLFVRNLVNLENLNIGINRDRVLLVALDSSHSGHRDQQLSRDYQQLLERFQSVPGVRSASICWIPPISGGGSNRTGSVEGSAAHPLIYENWVAPRYFETVGMPLLAGRDFSLQDQLNSPRVAIINQKLAHDYFAGSSPIGRHITFDGEDKPYEIIAVVGDAKYLEIREATPPTVYLGTFQQLRPASQFVIRTAAHPLEIAPEVRRIIRELLRTVTIGRVMTLAEHVDASIVQERLVAMISGVFGALGSLLAAIGIYGLLAYTVARRTNEIGIRMALGATRRNVIGMVLREASLMVATGLILGVPVALAGEYAATRMISDLSVGHGMSIMLGVAAMFAVALLAAWLPARRASRVDPMVALRYE